MRMRIAAVRVENYRRLNQVEIEPDADCAIVLIGGACSNGKSSLLGALSAAFGGKKVLPPDPVRHGADSATIDVRLVDDASGQLEIKRVVKPDGETTIEVRDRHGAIRSPQAVLDQLIGSRFLDPLAFLRLKPLAQRAALMKVIPGADRIAQINANRECVFGARTAVGRDLKKAEGELARLPPPRPVPELIDVAALVAERDAFAQQQRAGDGIGHVVAQLSSQDLEARAHVARELNEIADLERALQLARERHAKAVATAAKTASEVEAANGRLRASAAAWFESAPRREQVVSDLRRATEHNHAVHQAQVEAERREAVGATVSRLKAETEQLTAQLVAFDSDKAAILAEAMLPVDGLSIAEQGIMLGGVPFEQAGDAERLRTALFIAAAASPDLDDVWIRDGALLDEESLALVERHAAATGRRIWIERVGTRDPGVIEIRDGRVAGGQP